MTSRRHMRGGFMLGWVLTLLLAIASAPPAAAGNPPQGSAPGGFVFVEGEELVYNVRYAFINLGQVRITTVARMSADGKECYYTRALIDSYKGIPFVDLHAVFESTIDHARLLAAGLWVRSNRTTRGIFPATTSNTTKTTS